MRYRIYWVRLVVRVLLMAVPALAGCGAPATPSVTPTPFEIVSTGEYVWQEGEAFLSQSGSDAADFKIAASNGQCLGMGWGSCRGHFVSGKRIGSSPSMVLKPTGGWGYTAGEWKYQKLLLGSMEAGKYTMKFVSQLDDGVVNIDGFFIADESFRP